MPEKLTEEQQKAKEAADKAKQEQGEQELTKLAEGLRERAAAGEDFTKLQKEAFEAAGIKMDSPTVNLPKVRRTGLPPAHAAVFDLKVGEVSAVIADNGGHYVYKVVSKEVLPLDQVGDEIRNSLKTQRMKEMMDKYANSYHAETNEAYFGPPGPSGRRWEDAPAGCRSEWQRLQRSHRNSRKRTPRRKPHRSATGASVQAELMASEKPVVVVTGIAGNLGSRLLPLLGDFSVIGVDVSPPQTDSAAPIRASGFGRGILAPAFSTKCCAIPGQCRWCTLHS